MADSTAQPATAAAKPESFAYRAQTDDGKAFSGTIDADDAEQASRLLRSLRLSVLEITPVHHAAPRPRTLRGDDFFAFNQQLTFLTRAGLPVEHGLRLIAQDMRRGRLKETVRQLAAELERGTPLDQAFEKQKAQFPPLYAQLIAAGVATSNLPGMLLNLGRHMEMVYRLRAMLWRAFAYPAAVLAGLLGVLLFLGFFVIPQFEEMFKSFRVDVPPVTQLLLLAPRWMPYFVAVLIILFVGIPIVWFILRMSGRDRAAFDKVIIPLPLIGSVLWRNMIARWCDAVRLAVQAGLDLPRAIELASEAIASPTLREDGRELIRALESGQPLDRAADRMLFLPATIPAAMALSDRSHDLAATLATLSEMYQQQAEVRLGMIPGVLTPMLIILVALLVGVVIMGLFLPFLALIRSLTH